MGREIGGTRRGVAPRIVCVVGWKDSGKTGTVVALAAELVRRGHRVMTAKHGHGFDLDTEGTDSWRHRHEAGAHRVALVGPETVAVMGGWEPDGEPSLAEAVRRYLSDADVVVAEGWKGGPEPKIEVHRAATGRDPIVTDGPPNAGSFLALATDREDLELEIPVLDLAAPDLAARLADIVEATLLG